MTFDPFEPATDLYLFLDAKPLVTEHRKQWANPETGHTNTVRRGCPRCLELAMWALASYAGRARKQGWTRQEGIDNLLNHPATYGSMAAEGQRLNRTTNGYLAKPFQAAFGSVYTDALTSAHQRGELDVPVQVAQELLGWVIRFVHDEHRTISPGNFVPWAKLEADLDWAHLPAGTPAAETVFTQIVAACEAVPRACKLLDKHVFSHSEGLAAHVATLTTDRDGDIFDPIEMATEDQSLTSCSANGYERLVEMVAQRLEAPGVISPEAAHAAAKRAIRDVYGAVEDSPELQELVSLVAQDATEAVRNTP